MSHVPLVSSYYNIPVDGYYVSRRRRPPSNCYRLLCCCLRDVSFTL
ncbi:unnamed protein product [Brugia timori]|uniref:Uncharacterized protein n=1 Tax=Brugia timori TaxID=42155 RepID=A0A0R3QCJ9_9BILA|nr:unnamed protein product [Brugia timori]